MRWIDIHSHLDMLEEGADQAIKSAAAVGVDRIITIGTEPADHPLVLSIAKKHFPVVSCTIGIHPHHGTAWSEEVAKFIEDNVGDPSVVAIGEIGLDYYYNSSPAQEQKVAFRRQLELASKYKMPVEIHTRDAEQDTVDILSEFKGQVTGVIHCFTGSHWLAHQCLDLGYNISISGVVTFKNAQDLRDTVKTLPLDRIHVETDAPFLAPVPMRGKKNTPAFVVHTATAVAELKGISVEKLSEITCENARHVFPKIIW